MADLEDLTSEPEELAEAGTVTYLTPEGYKKLHQELEYLTLTKRPEIAERIRESQEHGEFSEDNSELDEVKFEQAMVENRVAELKTIFSTAQILTDKVIPTDRVGIGSKVKLQDVELREEFEVQIVSSIEADPSRDLVSTESPLGEALLGSRPGDTVVVVAPDGNKVYKVLSISK